MKEIIEKIEEFDTHENRILIHDPPPDEKYGKTYNGYKIYTNKQEIILGITNIDSCCENWGYFVSNDNIDNFVGAELLGISVTDTCLRTHKLPEPNYNDEFDAIFVDIKTSNGVLQFTAYNDGRYGHTAIVVSNQLNVEKYL